jgi:hypothetical protein
MIIAFNENGSASMLFTVANLLTILTKIHYGRPMLMTPLHIKKSTLPGLLLALLLAISTIADARLTGEAELGYVKYDQKQDGNKFIEAHSFQQRYSLLYSTAGRFGDGRLGGYNVSLGYEWGSFDAKVWTPDPVSGLITDSNPSVSAGHVMFEGEVQVAPVELPFRFRAYSRDLNRITFGTETQGYLISDYMIRPGVTTNLIDGTHISSGATAVFGATSGGANGYNAIFRHIPMLMVDYRDELIRDLKSLTPTDTRMSRLAFVSLNKKDNWFHYRRTRYTDNIIKDQSWTEDQFQLGTIDHLQQRKWIDLTNWIKISADGQFTKRNSLGRGPADSFEAYDVNMFGIATRQRWEGKSFVTFNRTMRNRRLTYDESIPVYLSGVSGPETEWRIRLSSRLKSDEELLTGVKTNQSFSGASLRIDTFKRSKFTMSNTVSVESSDTGSTKNLALAAGVETASTRRFSALYTLAAGYNISSFSTDNATGNTNYLLQTITARAGYTPSQKLRFSLDETLTIASGANPRADSNTLITVNSTLLPATNDSFARRDSSLNDYARSVTMLTTTWNPAARFDISLFLTEDILDRPGAPLDYLTVVRNTVTYRMSQQLAIRIDNRFVNAQPADTSGYLGRGSVDYTPNRRMDAQFVYEYSRDSGPTGTSAGVDISQRFNYYFYKVNGVSRRLLELSESLSYREVDPAGSSSLITEKRISLGARYYPLKRLFLAGTTSYSLNDPGNVSKYIVNGSIGVNFRALQANIDYTYGKMTGGDNRIEKRLAANVKKIF